MNVTALDFLTPLINFFTKLGSVFVSLSFIRSERKEALHHYLENARPESKGPQCILDGIIVALSISKEYPCV